MAETLVNALHPSVVDRMDPQFAAIYTKYQAPRIRADQVTYEEYNADRSKYTFSIAAGPSPEVGSTKVYKVPVTEPAGEIDVQIYIPTEEAIAKGGLKNKAGKLPVHIDYHGGGFVIGGLGSDDPWCRQYCQEIGCIILNVAYRTSPEFPHPVPGTDSWAALLWAFENADMLGIDPTRVSVGGGSAGGQLAAVMALKARDEPKLPPLVYQMLIVPLVDVRFIPLEGSCAPDVPYKSYIENEFAPCLPLNRLRWFYRLWLGTDMEKRKKMAEDWFASPILAPSHANLAPAGCYVAEIDTLTSEGIAYHEKLVAAGTPSTLKVYKGCGHPFSHWDAELDKSREFLKDSADALKKAFALKE